jgi:hypothetical protein
MRSSSPHPALVFCVIFVFIFLLHAPLLQLPYFWDEAGYYVPAARDFLLTGSLIPHSTLSNAHPPLVMVWLALWWRVAGYAPLVTRSAMLIAAALSLLGVFRLAERAANIEVAIAATLCTAVYPVFFAQSSLAHVDLASAGLVCWGLWAYLDDRPVMVAVWFSLAAMAKETAILAPMALAGWELLRPGVLQKSMWRKCAGTTAFAYRVERSTVASRRILPLLVPVLPLALWYSYHYIRTGYILGNPEFFRYNVTATISVTRFLLALGLRLWQSFGYLHLWVLTLGMVVAMLLSPVKDGGVERPRIAIPVQMIFLIIIAAYVLAMALVGGAVLARYMLPAVPLVIIVAVSTLRRRLRVWALAIAVVVVAFVAAWFWNPPYGFSPEDNLAYRDYVLLHQDGERFLEARYPMARVLTAWPASDELMRPWLGYVTRPVQVVRIENFSLDEVLSAADFRSNYDVALVFSTKYEAAHALFVRWKKWGELKTRFFGFHRDVPPGAIAPILRGHIVFSEARKGQWIAVIEIAHDELRDAGAASNPVNVASSRPPASFAALRSAWDDSALSASTSPPRPGQLR